MRRLGRSVAQPGRALCSGRRGRRFEILSLRPIGENGGGGAVDQHYTPSTRQRAKISRGRARGTMRIRLGAYELEKRGVARYDWRDPYYFAVALSWPWFLFFAVAAFCILDSVFAVLLHGAARIGR